MINQTELDLRCAEHYQRVLDANVDGWKRSDPDLGSRRFLRLIATTWLVNLGQMLAPELSRPMVETPDSVAQHQAGA